MAQPARKSDDPESAKETIRPKFQVIQGDDEESGPPSGDLKAVPDEEDNPDKLSAEELKAAEEAGESTSSSETDEDDDGGFYKEEDDDKGKTSFRITRKQAAGGSVAALLVGALITLFSFLQGPLQIVHFGQLLQKFHFTNNEEFMDGRAGRYIRHMYDGRAERTRLGLVKNKFADRAERRIQRDLGVKSVYSDGVDRRLIGYEVIDEKKAATLLEDLEADGVNTNGTARGADYQGNKTTGRFIDVESNSVFSATEKRVSKTIVKASSHNSLSGTLAKRLLIRRGGVDFHPLKNIKRQAGESLLKYYRNRKEERSERRKTGTNLPDGTLEGDQGKDTNGDGKPDEPGTAGDANAGNDILNEARDIEKQALDNAEKGLSKEGKKALTDKLLDKIKSKLTAGGAAAAIGATLCVINDVNKNLDDYKYQNMLIMMRMGMEIVTAGNQVMTGQDVNIDELGSLSNDLYDEGDETSWVSAASVQAELGKEPTGPDMSDDIQVGTSNPKLFDAVSKIHWISGVCGIQDKAIGFLKKIPLVGRISNIAESAITSGINSALQAVGLPSIEEFYSSVIRFFAGGAVNTFAQGSELGNIVNYGARIAGNDQAIAQGGQELTQDQEKKLDQTAQAERTRYLATRGFFERFLDPYSVDSLAGQTIIAMPHSPRATMAAILSAPGKLFSSFAKIGSGRVLAATGSTKYDYDYGFSEFGYTYEEQEDKRFDNPFTNAEYMEANDFANLRTANDKYGECFSMRLEPPTTPDGTVKLQSGPSKQYNKIREKVECSDKSELLIRYRFYIADTISSYTLACYEEDEESCAQLGFGNVDQASSQQAAGTGVVTADVQTLAQQMLANPNIKYWTNKGVNTRDVVVALSQGQPAYTTCGNASNATAEVNPSILQFIVDAAQVTKVMVNALTDKCHSNGSNHYSGEAVDLDVGNSGPLSVLDPIARKYGGTKNSETSHHHYDFPKR